jgi:S1-C subfamily serine protease
MNSGSLSNWAVTVIRRRHWVVYELVNHTCEEVYIDITNRSPKSLKKLVKKKSHAFERWDWDDDEIEEKVVQSGLTKEEAQQQKRVRTSHSRQHRQHRRGFSLHRNEVVALSLIAPVAIFVISQCPDWFQGARNFLVPALAKTSLEEAPPEAFFLANIVTFFLFAVVPLSIFCFLASLAFRHDDVCHGLSFSPRGEPRRDEPEKKAPGEISADAEPSRWTNIVQEIRRLVPILRTPTGTGSGLLVSPSGLIITNAHVAEVGVKLTVRFQDETTCKAVCIHRHSRLDLAVVQAATQSQTFFDLNSRIARDYKEGEEVLGVGHPVGLTFTCTRGIISQCERRLDKDVFVQTDIATNPGNSGGPLLDSSGKLVGLHTRGYSQAHGIAFAIPSNQVLEYWTEVSELIRSGKLAVPSDQEIVQIRDSPSPPPKPTGRFHPWPASTPKPSPRCCWIPSVS